MIGVILAGGLGRRMGGGKATRDLNGRPLASYPAAALRASCDRVAIVGKRDSDLPELEGVERWDEPDAPRHPLTGIIYALERAGEDVLVCAADMPRVTPQACRVLIAARAIATSGGRLQPLLGVYRTEWIDALRDAAPDAPLTRTVEAAAPPLVELPEDLVVSIDTPEALRAIRARRPER